MTNANRDDEGQSLRGPGDRSSESRYRSDMETRREHPVTGPESKSAVGRERSSPSHPLETPRRPLWDFLVGAAGIFDFVGNITWSRVSTVKRRTDAEALAGDWYAVGDDLRRAMDRCTVPEDIANRHRDRS